MAKTVEEILAKRPVDRVAVEGHKKHLLDEVRAFWLRELREASDLTQVEVAARSAREPEQGVPHRAR